MLAFHSGPIGAFRTGLGSCSIPSQSWQMQRIGAGGRYAHMELKKTWNESRKSWKRMSSAKAFVPFVWSHLNRKMAKSKAVAFNLEVSACKTTEVYLWEGLAHFDFCGLVAARSLRNFCDAGSDRGVRKLECKHGFHAACIDNWLRESEHLGRSWRTNSNVDAMYKWQSHKRSPS